LIHQGVFTVIPAQQAVSQSALAGLNPPEADKTLRYIFCIRKDRE
jgi:hypothetical protein